MKFTPIGFIVKPHGLKGSVVLKLEAGFIEQMKNFREIYLERFGSHVPYVIEEYAPLGINVVKLTLKGVKGVEEAENLRGIAVSQSNDALKPTDGLDLKGFNIQLRDGTMVGRVVDELDTKAQTLLVVQGKNEEEFLIPLVDSFIVRIDKQKHLLVMELPEGLLDL